MSRIVVIGATGHIGTYLVPRLALAGHDVIAVSRGVAKPYQQSGAWSKVTTVVLDRESEEAAGTFGTKIADLGADIVIDCICFTLASSNQLADALEGKVSQFIHVGTIWTHGFSTVVPTPNLPLNFHLAIMASPKLRSKPTCLSAPTVAAFR